MLHYMPYRRLRLLTTSGKKTPAWVLALPNSRHIDGPGGKNLLVALEDLRDVGLLDDEPVPARYQNPFTSYTNPDGRTDRCINGCRVSRNGLLVRNTTFVVQDGVVSLPDVCFPCFKKHLLTLRCHFCGELPGHDGRKPTIEHLTPRTRAGADHPDNLAPACNTCNARKATKTEGEFMAWIHDANEFRAKLRRVLDGDDGNFRQLTFWDL